MDWSAMIPDLLKCISDKLPHCFDYFNFRLVCTQWRSASQPKKFSPIFFLPSNPYFGELRFFDPSDGGIHPLPLPDSAQSKIICSASRGWFALMDDTTKSMYLVNPITAVQYPIPPDPQEPVFDFHDRESCPSADSDDDGICDHRFVKDHHISHVFIFSRGKSA